MLTVEKYGLGEVIVNVSCGSSIKLGIPPNIAKTISVSVSGGADPGGRPVTYDVQCASAKSVTKVNDTTWSIVLEVAGIHVIQGYAINQKGYKAVKTATVQATPGSTSSGTTSGQFVGETFDSGWTNVVQNCYISDLTCSLSISSGHSSSNDYFVILGKKTDGTIVILRDVFNSANRFKTIAEGAEMKNALYKKGNLSSKTWGYNADPYTLDNDIRQLRFICETPGHASCASQARVSFSMNYSYDPNLK